ncbi:hypothetical protein [Methylobacter sp. BlB1]|jgi:hypothetical protein|uniref:hypothetical protein n=2 Tax=unclassified Methylobacter TaxID=2635283 RepID=UPI001893C1C2|nr:hypothetical protein [Methylobacter sp. BlB1]
MDRVIGMIDGAASDVPGTASGTATDARIMPFEGWWQGDLTDSGPQGVGRGKSSAQKGWQKINQKPRSSRKPEKIGVTPSRFGEMAQRMIQAKRHNLRVVRATWSIIQTGYRYARQRFVESRDCRWIDESGQPSEALGDEQLLLVFMERQRLSLEL